MNTGVLETLQAALQQVLEFETSGSREGGGVPQHRVDTFKLRCFVIAVQILYNCMSDQSGNQTRCRHCSVPFLVPLDCLPLCNIA